MPERPPATLIPGVIYARQSETKEGSGSLSDQLVELRRSATRLGVKVVAEIVEPDSTSGFKARGLERPRWRDTLLPMLARGEARAVLVLTTDRLSRGGGPGYAPFFEAIEGAGLDPDRVVATPGGWVSEWELGIRSAMDREEARKISYRVALASSTRAAGGKPHGGRRPFGYEADAMTVRPCEAELVREAAARAIAGETPWGIARTWNERGVPSRSGGTWQAMTVRRILTSPRNAGIRQHRGQATAVALWEPLLDRETWDRVQTVLVASRGLLRAAGGGKARKRLLTGIIKCGRCGMSLHGRQRADGSLVYQCLEPESLAGACGKLSIVGEAVEADVVAVVFGTLLDPENQARMPKPEGAGPDFSAVRRLEEKRERLVDLYADGGLSKAQLAKRLAPLEIELADEERRVSTTIGRIAYCPRNEAELAEAWATRGIEWQRLVVTSVIEELSVRPGRTLRPADRLQYRLR